MHVPVQLHVATTWSVLALISILLCGLQRHVYMAYDVEMHALGFR